MFSFVVLEQTAVGRVWVSLFSLHDKQKILSILVTIQKLFIESPRLTLLATERAAAAAREGGQEPE